jgi:two-component system response regulator AtoC
MPAGSERERLVQHVEDSGCPVVTSEHVAEFLASASAESCMLALLDFGDSENGAPGHAERREAIRTIKERFPRLQLALWLDRSSAAEAAEMNELGIRNLYLKPVRYEPIDGLLKAAGKSAAQQARQQRETARVRDEFRFDRIVGQSTSLKDSIGLAQSVAESSATSVLLLGESGVGKELVARAIHQRSTRKNKPFVKVNCAALPAELLESELFGHERGAFTGAATTRIGKFEQADGGTLMLDEIGEMKPALQAKLLHVLQDAEFTKLGSNKRIQVDVRIVAATNRDLEKMLVSGDFREDLYYRLKVIELTVPALRERPDEIATLTDFFIARYSRKYNRPARPISEELRQLFGQYEWPGNIRELENMIKRVVILQDEQLVVGEIQRNMQRAAAVPAVATAAAAVPLAAFAAAGAGAFPVGMPLGTPPFPPLAEPEGDQGADESEQPREGGGSLASVAKAAAMKAERAAIETTLRQVHWNRRKAAQILGVSYKTLLNKIKECGISRA